MINISCPLIANLDVVRVTRVNNCGAPVVGENAFVTECLASVAMNPNIDTPDDVVYRAANGTICGLKRGCPSLLGYDIELDFFQASPQLISVLTNQPLVLDFDGEPTGWDDCSVACSGGFALEFWSQLIGDGCADTEGEQWLYVLLPWVTNAYLSDLTIGSEQTTFQLLGNTRAGGQWSTGPYDVVLNGPTPGTPGPMLTPLAATCHRRITTTAVPPPVPDPACDYATVPALTP